MIWLMNGMSPPRTSKIKTGRHFLPAGQETPLYLQETLVRLALCVILPQSPNLKQPKGKRTNIVLEFLWIRVGFPGN